MEAALLTQQKPHPIFIIAAISMILFSLVGIAAMTGLLPTSKSQTKASPVAASPATTPVVTQPVAYTPIPQSALAPAPAPQVVTHTHTDKVSAHTHTLSEPKTAVRKVSQARTTAAKPVRVATAKPVRKQVARKPRHTQYVHNDGYRSDRDQNLSYARYDELYRTVNNDPYRTADYRRCNDCGRVESVEARATPGQGSGLGAVAGGVAGALLGKQIGKGNGNKAATILGAIGGAYAGDQAERYVRKTETYDVNVRMDDGSYRTVTANQPNTRVGEQVRVVDGVIVSQ